MSENISYYVFDKNIEYEHVSKLLEFMNANTGKISILISSYGGITQLGRSLVHVLNQNAERIELVATERVYSCAFKIFKNFKGKKYLSYGCSGMYHYGSQDIRIAYHNKPNYKREGESDMNYNTLMKRHDETWCKEFMTKREFSEYKKNEDIYFSFHRMKQIFKDAEII